MSSIPWQIESDNPKLRADLDVTRSELDEDGKSYRSCEEHPPEPSDDEFPEPERVDGIGPMWKPATIERWAEREWWGTRRWRKRWLRALGWLPGSPFGSTDCGGRVSVPAVGLFDKKLPRTSDLFEAKGIKGPPHLAWEADYGENRLRDLTIGTRELFGLIESTKASTGRDRVPTVSIRERLG